MDLQTQDNSQYISSPVHTGYNNQIYIVWEDALTHYSLLI